MSLSSLHTIGLQLIMHLCDASTILRLARCSRTLLAAASCDFAFRFASPVAVPIDAGLSERVSGSLVRFCDLSLVELPRPDARVHPAIDMHPLRLASVFPRVCEIQLISELTNAEWAELLQHPNLRGLRSLSAPGTGFDVGLMPSLRNLHTLRFLNAVPIEVLALLRDLPLLTDVARVPCWHMAGDRLMLDQLTACTGIQRISLRSWSPMLVDTLCRRHNFSSRLVDCSFVNCALDASRVDWKDTLGCLSSLRRLMVDRCENIMSLLHAAAAMCRRLELITVRPHPRQWSEVWCEDEQTDSNSAIAGEMALPAEAWFERRIIGPRIEMHEDDARSEKPAPLTLQLWAAEPDADGVKATCNPRVADAFARLSEYAAQGSPASDATPSAFAAVAVVRFELVTDHSRLDWLRPLMDAYARCI